MGELEDNLQEAVAAPTNANVGALSEELGKYLDCLAVLFPLLDDDRDGTADAALADLLDQTKEDLVEAYLAFSLGRRKLAFMALRGVMEGLFSALYYRYQQLSRELWARDAAFQMVHRLFEMSDKNEFYKFFGELFDDEQFRKTFSGCSGRAVFKQADHIYNRLSRFIHKKFGPTEADFSESVADVFRIFLTFVERTDDDISTLTFPAPLTWVEQRYGSKT